MKKFFKSKFEKDNISSYSDSNQQIDNEDKVAMNRRLPPNTPGPDCMQTQVLKEDVKEDEFRQPAVHLKMEEKLPIFLPKSMNNDDKPDNKRKMFVSNYNEPEKKKKLLCKDFIRKICTHGSACNYAHEIITDQMEHVYQFCKDFQNGKCRRASCNYVHATIFEKECFCRTGELPTHVFDHLKTHKQQTAYISPAVYNRYQPANLHSSDALVLTGGPVPVPMRGPVPMPIHDAVPLPMRSPVQVPMRDPVQVPTGGKAPVPPPPMQPPSAQPMAATAAGTSANTNVNNTAACGINGFKQKTCKNCELEEKREAVLTRQHQQELLESQKLDQLIKIEEENHQRYRNIFNVIMMICKEKEKSLLKYVNTLNKKI